MNNAIIIQQCLSTNAWTGAWAGQFYDMLRLSLPRHSTYARAHNFDYQVTMGDVHPEQPKGAYPKVHLIKDALERGYEYVAWLDTDAAVMNMECDLRDALPPGAFIGAVRHDPRRSQYLRGLDVPAHYNVGVLYVRNGPRVVDFFTAWAASYPGHPRWMEQGVFNDMVSSPEWAGLLCEVADTWNATVNVNPVENPNVQGWHGIMPPVRRLAMMQAAMAEDFAKFRV